MVFPWYFYDISMAFLWDYYGMGSLMAGWWLNQPLWKMMDFVSWDDDIPNMMGKIIHSCSKPLTSIDIRLCSTYRSPHFQPSNLHPIILSLGSLGSLTASAPSSCWAANGGAKTKHADPRLDQSHAFWRRRGEVEGSQAAKKHTRRCGKPVVFVRKMIQKFSCFFFQKSDCQFILRQGYQLDLIRTDWT